MNEFYAMFLIMISSPTDSLKINKVENFITNPVRYNRVDNAIDQLEFHSAIPIKNIYLDHEDENVRYKFMLWNNHGNKALVYDHYTNVDHYDVVVETVDGKNHKFRIENLNKSE